MGASKAVDLLRAAIVDRGWTQNELARRLGTDSAVVSRWMTGQRKPGLGLAMRIETLLGVSSGLWLETADESGSLPVVDADKTG